MNNSVVLSILLALGINEFLGVTDWLADRIIRWAAHRWKERTGFDHLDELREDLEHSPGRLLKVVTASWFLLSTFIGPSRTTLNLPSLWRLSRPVRDAVRETLALIREVARAIERRMAQRLSSRSPNRIHLLVIRIAASTLPRDDRLRYIEEWVSELHVLTGRECTSWTLQIALGSPGLALALRRHKAGSS